MLLALHRVIPEVRKHPEPSGAQLLPDFRCNRRNLPHVVRPELALRRVLLRHREQHHRHPPEDVLYDDDLLVLVDDIPWLCASYNVAKDTIGTHAAR